MSLLCYVLVLVLLSKAYKRQAIKKVLEDFEEKKCHVTKYII